MTKAVFITASETLQRQVDVYIGAVKYAAGLDVMTGSNKGCVT